MALFHEARLLICDENNVPIPGGKARFRNANTVVLTALKSDAALTTPLTNPVVADANGWTPQIFAAEGTVCDVQYLTAADVEIPSRNYVDVTALGSDTGAFTRLLAGGTRFAISDSAGRVLMRVGDPDPDSVGGALTIEGWDGTQGDDLVLDFAATNTTGIFTENSKKLPGVVSTAATAFSAASTVDIALTEDPANVRGYRVDIFDLVNSAASVILGLRFSYDGGANYKSGASDYAFAHAPYYDSAGTLGVVSRDDAETHIKVNPPSGVAITTDRKHWLVLEILTPESGTTMTVVRMDMSSYEDLGTDMPLRSQGTGYGLGSYGRATHVRLFVASGGGTLTGAYRVMPMRGYGE